MQMMDYRGREAGYLKELEEYERLREEARQKVGNLSDNVAKFALALSSLGNVRTRTARAWSEPEFQKLISELP